MSYDLGDLDDKKENKFWGMLKRQSKKIAIGTLTLATIVGGSIGFSKLAKDLPNGDGGIGTTDTTKAPATTGTTEDTTTHKGNDTFTPPPVTPTWTDKYGVASKFNNFADSYLSLEGATNGQIASIDLVKKVMWLIGEKENDSTSTDYNDNVAYFVDFAKADERVWDEFQTNIAMFLMDEYSQDEANMLDTVLAKLYNGKSTTKQAKIIHKNNMLLIYASKYKENEKTGKQEIQVTANLFAKDESTKPANIKFVVKTFNIDPTESKIEDLKVYLTEELNKFANNQSSILDNGQKKNYLSFGQNEQYFADISFTK